MVFETIWNCRELDENNLSKACILMVSETISNYREIDENNVHQKHAFWRIWNDVELQKSNWKQYT